MFKICYLFSNFDCIQFVCMLQVHIGLMCLESTGEFTIEIKNQKNKIPNASILI